MQQTVGKAQGLFHESVSSYAQALLKCKHTMFVAMLCRSCINTSTVNNIIRLNGDIWGHSAAIELMSLNDVK